MGVTGHGRPARLRARTWIALALALGGAALAGCATTGSVSGRVFVSGHRAGSSGEAVITATPARAPEPTLGSGQAVITLAGGRFVPGVLLVEPGTTVHFLNRDRVFHNAFSISPVNRFDLGSVAPGHEREIRFERPGIIEVYCELHPREVAYVVVAPRRCSTRPQSDGMYVLAGLTPGAYAVRAWHPSLGSQTRRIELPPHGRVTVNFSY